HVAALVEDAIAIHREPARFEHVGAELPTLPERDRRIGRDEPDASGISDGMPAPMKVRALAIIDPTELAIDAPEIEPRRERQRPIARVLDRFVASDRQTLAARCGLAAP